MVVLSKIRKNDLQSIDFDGLKIFDYKADLNDNSSSFAVIDVPDMCNHMTAYSNRSDKYYYVVFGEVCFTIEGNKLIFKEGDFCLIKQGERFSYTNNSGNIAKLVLVHTPRFNLEDEVFIKE